MTVGASFNMFTVTWDHMCFECCAPLKVKLVCKGENFDEFFRVFGSWSYLRPFHLYYNVGMYKFYGLKLKRVCITCYFTPERVCLRDRECGIKRVVSQEVRSKSCEEIKEYFEDYTQFRKRQDLEMCIVDEWKRDYPGGLDTYWY